MADGEVHPFLELIRRRASIERFDTERGLDDGEIRALVEAAIEAPSSFNIQHWRFVAVRRPEDKRRLRAAAYDQEQVEQAAVTFIVLGDLQGIDRLPEIVDRAVDSGVLPAEKGVAWVRMAREIYDDPQTARDEALRSASLAAMLLMLAAEARGLASGALSGFDVARVKDEFGIDERYVPVMLLAVGYPLVQETRRQPRLSVDDVLSFDRGRIF